MSPPQGQVRVLVDTHLHSPQADSLLLHFTCHLFLLIGFAGAVGDAITQALENLITQQNN